MTLQRKYAGAIVFCAAAAVFCFLFRVNAAHGDDIDEAKERFKRGLMFVDEGDCGKALVEFEASHEIYPTAVVLYNMALCNDDLHKNAEALKYYSQYLDEAEGISKDKEEAIRERVGQLEKMVGRLSVTAPAKEDVECPPGTVYFHRPAAYGGLEHRANLEPLYRLETNPVKVDVQAPKKPRRKAARKQRVPAAKG